MSAQATAYTMAEKLSAPPRRIRLGIVGGAGGFIGPVHALAARMDNRYELVAGALSSRPDVSKEAGKAWFLPPDRVYGDYREMARAEAGRPDGIEAVAITTPNHLHYDAAKAFLDAGIHVICDKPLTTTLDDALLLVEQARRTGLCFFVTHGFAAYPMIREARARVADGRLGTVRLVHVEFVMDWLTDPIDLMGDRHAAWRTDPATSGAGGAIADIGTHAYHLARFVSGQEVTGLSAALHTMVPGRRLDDNGHLLLEFENGAKGTMIVTQVAPGNECGLRIRVYGDKAGLEWRQDDADHLRFSEQGKPVQIIGRGEAGLSADAQRMTRVPRGHPEGYLEAFANIYSEIAAALWGKISGTAVPHPVACATVEDGAIGIAFIEAALRSSRQRGEWVDPRLPSVDGSKP
ncbi:Gfo/Idh/MocA family oxidoreductase [Shinella daejeonensis]|uniref:Gfo/Idh/MocA family protein n=1 Tax=Shinella daejeonensis TaxID=659017 RepID=UPI0020C7D04E|nr:Gfo/Idh/MocA family oxidoreductase [Shinella daejeonensis]MCP8894638.1 Gfo/Idh/MocA family oxidoreductase [Shinella daejeonensis]